MTVALKTRQRLKDELPYYAERCLKIRAKDGRIILLRLNDAQQYIHQRIEAQRHERGLVRALLLKGRQQGSSTYVQARFYHHTTHGRGLRAFILTHEDKATKYLFDITDRFHRNCPRPVRPHTGAANANELVFDRLDSGYSVGTAKTKETGRSFTIQLFHGSEVAYWPNARAHMSGIMQAIPDAPGSEVILESTSAGATGAFHAMWQAAEAGELDYLTIFVPWYWQKEYRRPVPKGFELTSEEEAYRALYSLDLEQIAWRRHKIIELGSVYEFRREYPATAAEAFSVEMPGALWTRQLLDQTRVATAPPLVRVVVAVDPASKSNENSNETGIVVAGIAADTHVYILNDLSIKALPAVWAARALSAKQNYRAGFIVYEDNQGGENVAQTLRAADGTVALKAVTAHDNKQARAEPISLIWAGVKPDHSDGRIHMVGHHIALEDQLCTWQPQTGDESPDRLDAMVWACHELLVTGAGGVEWGRYIEGMVRGDAAEQTMTARGTVRTKQ